VSAAGLSRILAYAGESVVQARRLGAQADALLGLKRAVDHVARAVDRAAERLRRESISSRAREAFLSVRTQVAHLRQSLSERAEAVENAVRQGADVAGRLYGEVLGSRLRPFRDILGNYPRLVRELSRELGRRVRLEVTGRDVLVDRDILEALDAPLGHMVRNAIDHGIEPPAEREARGKDPVGVLRISARHHAGMVEVRVSDDGRGLDPEAVRRRVVERSLVPAEIAPDLREEELLEFLFLPGFSTAREVTQVSGRGVGLDVVQTMAREAGGSVRAERRAEAGAALVLPITRSVLRVALVEVAGEPYALPLTQIDRIVRVGREDVTAVEGRQAFRLDDQAVGLVPAAEVLGVRGGTPPDGDIPVVVVHSGRDVYGLAVDRFLGEQTLDVRTLEPRLGKVTHVSALAIDDRGEPLLILDVQDLLRSVDLLLHEGRLRTARALPPAAAAGSRPVKRILVVDDSITVREVERKLLSNRGYAVDVCVDGADGWSAVSAQAYDLVLTDVDMPRMDGIELVRRIRGEARLARLPVMIVSYKDRPEDRMRGLEAGANAYVTKSSFHEDALVREVVHLIGEPHEEKPSPS
jgi:two-component system sensor histidine kinase and response regulator WspE